MLSVPYVHHVTLCLLVVDSAVPSLSTRCSSYLALYLLFRFYCFVIMPYITPQSIKFSFLTVSIWWFVFSIPLFLNVSEFKQDKIKKKNIKIREATVDGFKQLKTTFHKIKKLRMVLLFLAAYWLYIDGVDTIVRMAVDYGMSLGFNSSDLITALLITQFVGFPAAIAFGYLAHYIGAKQGILIAIIVYFLTTLWASQMDTVSEFYILAIIIGLVQGGVQALSRSFYAGIIPKNQSAEFFGFYNMLGKFAAVLGPVMIGVVSVLTQSPRASILSISILFIAGGVLLYYVNEEKAKIMLAEYN